MAPDPDRVRLVEFLNDAEDALDDVVHSSPPILPDHLRAPAEDAWPDVKRAFLATRGAIQSTTTSSRKLAAAGLTGSSLRMKLQGYNNARAQLSNAKSGGGGKRVPRWLKRVLRWMNILLGSLSAVVPAAELLKEYKEAIEAGIEEGEND